MQNENTNQSESILLSIILKEFLNKEPEMNPFKDGFDGVAFIKMFKQFLQELSIDKTKIKDSGELIALLEINDIYESLMEHIENILNKINIDYFEIINRLLILSNKDAISISDHAFEAFNKKVKNVPKEWSEEVNVELTDFYGNKITLQEASDLNIEISNELIKIVNLYRPEHNPNEPSLPDDKINSALRHCMIYANLYFNLKNAFEYFQYEFGTIQRNNSEIKFKQDPHYTFLRQSGRDRFNNHIYEYSMHLWNFPFEIITKKSAAIISRNRLTFRFTGEKTENLNRKVSGALQAAYYHHLHSIKIKGLDNLTIQQVLLVISELKFLFESTADIGSTEGAEKNHKDSSIPTFINKKDLAHHLYKCLRIKETTISKILGAISSDLTASFDIWRTPLICQGPNYLFNSNTILHINTAYIANQILNKFISKEKQLEYFRGFISKYVMSKQKGLSLKIKHPTSDKRSANVLQNPLLFELETIYLILEPCIVSLPFSSQEYSQALKEITETSLILIQKAHALSEFFDQIEEKQIVCIVATNFPTHSGTMINNCHVMDHFLLTNYFSTGEYKRAIAIKGHKRLETRELSAFQYYKNDKEMSENLIDYCLKPAPILQIVLQYEIEENRISIPNSIPVFFRDAIKKLPLENTIWENVREIEYCLRQLYYFEKALDKNPIKRKIIEEKINYLLPLVLGAIAFQTHNRTARITVLEIFKKVGHQGLVYLTNSFKLALSRLNKPFEKSPPFEHFTCNHEIAMLDLVKLIKDNVDTTKNKSLSQFKLQHSFTDEEVKNILEHLIWYFSDIRPKKYDDQDLHEYYFHISIFSSLVIKHKAYERFLYNIFLNFIDTLNYNFQYQTAKNFAEEALIYSFDNQNLPLLGWLCQYKCFLNQNNIYDTAFYGALFVTCVELHPDADEELITHTLYNSMLFFRNYHFTEIEEEIYKVLINMDLSEYDEQKITLSHFSSRLQSKSLEDVEGDLIIIENYLNKNLEAIRKYKDKGALPWLTFLYNFRHLKIRGFIAINLDRIEDAISQLEKEIEKKDLLSLQAHFTPIPEISKEIFKDAIKKIFQSLDFNDAAHELENLESLAKNIISISLEPLDLASLLLTGLAINDQSLTFPRKEIQNVVPFVKSPDKELETRINDYKTYVFSHLTLYPGQELIWLFDVFDKVYSIRINHKLDYELIHLKNWSLKSMDFWMNKLSEFSFNDKGGNYFINEQEQDYIDLKAELNFAQIPISDKSVEIFLFTSIRLSVFPHNLLNTPLNNLPNLSELHVENIREHLFNLKNDFISFYKPITNVISLEWFLNNHNTLAIPIKHFQLECWIPIQDEDYALLIGYNKLTPILEETFGAKIVTDLIPEKIFDSTINIFMAHGGKGIEGFKTVYTRNEDGYAIIKEKGIETILGKGIIAVLFVCHSASISSEAFAQKLISLSHQILALGYKAVVAPSWSLNPLIAPVWLEKFLECLKIGLKLSESVHAANIKVAEKGFNEYHGFYAPSGWAAMHLYGNPNIYFC